MNELQKHDIKIRYIAEEKPNISGSSTPYELAQHVCYEFWDHRFGPVPEILDITVDGLVYIVHNGKVQLRPNEQKEGHDD